MSVGTCSIFEDMKSLRTVAIITDDDGNISEDFAEINDLEDRIVAHSLTGSAAQMEANEQKQTVSHCWNKLALDVCNADEIVATGARAIKTRWSLVSAALGAKYHGIYADARRTALWLAENGVRGGQTIKSGVGNYRSYLEMISFCVAHDPAGSIAIMRPNLTKATSDSPESQSGRSGRFIAMRNELMDVINPDLVEMRVTEAATLKAYTEAKEKLTDAENVTLKNWKFPESPKAPEGGWTARITDKMRQLLTA